MKTIEDFSQGDGWDEPYVSGFDILLEEAIADIDEGGIRYDEDEQKIILAYCESDTPELHMQVTDILQSYIDSKYNDCDEEDYYG